MPQSPWRSRRLFSQRAAAGTAATPPEAAPRTRCPRSTACKSRRRFRAERPQQPLAKTGTVGEELPGQGLGTVADPFWQATLGGYTQQTFSQALGFPPGTKITIKNLGSGISHTLNVVAKITGPPAQFPANPSLSMQPHGTTIKLGYASGIIKPGATVTVLAKKAGIYLIGCAFHYHEGMQDVLVIAKGATPGPQATAPAK